MINWEPSLEYDRHQVKTERREERKETPDLETLRERRACDGRARLLLGLINGFMQTSQLKEQWKMWIIEF